MASKYVGKKQYIYIYIRQASIYNGQASAKHLQWLWILAYVIPIQTNLHQTHKKKTLTDPKITGSVRAMWTIWLINEPQHFAWINWINWFQFEKISKIKFSIFARRT